MIGLTLCRRQRDQLIYDLHYYTKDIAILELFPPNNFHYILQARPETIYKTKLQICRAVDTKLGSREHQRLKLSRYQPVTLCQSNFGSICKGPCHALCGQNRGKQSLVSV